MNAERSFPLVVPDGWALFEPSGVADILSQANRRLPFMHGNLHRHPPVAALSEPRMSGEVCMTKVAVHEDRSSGSIPVALSTGGGGRPVRYDRFLWTE